MIEIILIMTSGMITGYIFRHKIRFIEAVEKLTVYAIYLLLLLLGMSVGNNDKLLSGFTTIGLNAIIISISGIAGSVLLSALVYRLFFRKGF